MGALEWCNELATAGIQVAVVVAIFSQYALGMVRQWQNLFYDARYSANWRQGNGFCGLAKTTEQLMNVTKPEEVDEALKKPLLQKIPVVIILNDKDDKVFPIVPPGAIDELIEE